MDHPAYQAIKTPPASAGSQGQTPPVPESPSPITSENPAQSNPPTQTTRLAAKNWKKWILIGGVIMVVLLTGTAYILSQQKDNKPVTKAEPIVTKASPTPDPTADWKTYSSTDGKFTLKYPPSWTFKEDKNTDNTNVTFSGNEGEINIAWGKGFGGGCPQGYEKLEVGGKIVDACHTIEQDGSEEWTLGAISASNQNYTGYIKANYPYKKNRGLVLQVLSTFKFTEIEIQPTTSSSPTSCPAAPVCKPGEQLIHGDPSPDSTNKCPVYSCVKTNGTVIN